MEVPIDATKKLAKVELVRRLTDTDFYFFNKNILGRDKMEEQPHREVCDVLMSTVVGRWGLRPRIKHPTALDIINKNGGKPPRKVLLLLPRDTFKSTIAAQGLPIWLLRRIPDLRIMLDCETLAQSKSLLHAIKELIVDNALLKAVSTTPEGKYLLEPNEKIAGGFTEDQIILKHKSEVGRREPSIFCSGVDNAKTGFHPDVIIMDDLVSEKNVTTEAQLQKVIDHYRFALSLLEPDGIVIIVGTRYHMADLYGHLLEQIENGEEESLVHLVRPAEDADGNLFFPTRLTREYLAEMRAAQGSYVFSSQYMLNPVSDENAVFRESWFRYYTEEDLVKPEFKIISTYITADLAISQKETADYTVVMAVGETADKKLIILDYDRERYTPNDQINSIFKMYLKHKKRNVKAVGIETVAYQKALFYMVQDEMRRRGTFMPLRELKADRDKIRRAQGLQPLFENGAVYMRKDMRALKQELLEFPVGRHDDTVDALAYILQLMKAGRKRTRALEEAYNPVNSVTGY